MHTIRSRGANLLLHQHTIILKSWTHAIDAFGKDFVCGIICAFSFWGCACVLDVPKNHAGCHQAGSECCPIPCGPTSNLLGVDVVFQCCYGGESCLRQSDGACCPPKTATCNGDTCCQPGVPCVEDQVCCPASQTTCQSALGLQCCSQGETCTKFQGCCPTGSACNDVCCGPFFECTDFDNSFCCTSNRHNSGGLCCSADEFNCAGMCCSGTCDISGCKN